MLWDLILFCRYKDKTYWFSQQKFNSWVVFYIQSMYSIHVQGVDDWDVIQIFDNLMESHAPFVHQFWGFLKFYKLKISENSLTFFFREAFFCGNGKTTKLSPWRCVEWVCANDNKFFFFLTRVWKRGRGGVNRKNKRKIFPKTWSKLHFP